MDIKFSPEFERALTLPTGNYYTPKLAHIKDDTAMLVRMDGTAITNSTSQFPVIGSEALNPCCAIILYNGKNKVAVLKHLAWPSAEEFQTLLSMVRSDASDQLDIHIVGKPFSHNNEDNINQMRVDSLNDILKAILHTPNATLQTFDVFKKPKPDAVAIDTRTGDLIRGSQLFTSYEESNRSKKGSLFDRWDCVSEVDENFDGTIPELQMQKKR